MNLFKRLTIIIGFILSAQLATAQIGGLTNYEFLNLSASAKITALGGYVISIADDDVSYAFANPALLNSKMGNHLELNHSSYFAGISHGDINYGYHKEKWKATFHGGVEYINFGDFIGTDETGTETSNFNAREQAYTIGAARQVGARMRIGMNMKLINSVYEAYSSLAWATDLGAYYSIPDKKVNFAFVVSNLGFPINSYNNQKEILPLNVQLGLSKQLAHLPFRLSVTMHHLNKWRLTYDDPSDQLNSIFGEEPIAPTRFRQEVDNLFRHFVFSGEFLFGKGFQVRFAYNYQRKKELSVPQFRSFGGFSLGFGLSIKRIQFDYGVGLFHLGQAVHHFGFGVNLDQLKKKI